ncbi:MAG: HU family DNA-binding protein [Prevotellaceae bacterium]|jgi:predicted histone-like DNA-binding protein|nr:HU family DNA-binding protein [Prevotellaceae bacterium]
MAVKYVVSEKGNPLKPAEPKKWYVSAKSTGVVTLKALGKQITQRSTVNQADTVAVLEGLTQTLAEQLAEGKIVRLGDFGSFQIRIGSDGAETAEKCNASLIRAKKVAFRPGADLKELLNNLKFEKL